MYLSQDDILLIRKKIKSKLNPIINILEKTITFYDRVTNVLLVFDPSMTIIHFICVDFESTIPCVYVQ